MNIAFFHYHHSTQNRGAESFVTELSKSLTPFHQTKIYSHPAPKVSSRSQLTLLSRLFLDPLSLDISSWTLSQLKNLKQFNPDIVMALNGGWQTLILRVWTWLNHKKLVIPGQSGPGWDDRWNLFLAPDVFVCLTNRQLKWATQAFHWGSTKLIQIPNGVDLDIFKPKGEIKKLKLEKPIILTVASSEKAKRVEETIKAVSKLKNASLLWIGTGEGVEKLELIGKDLLGSRFLHLALPYSQIPKYYRAADLFTLCSASSEAFGIVYLEALASGLPVVATSDESRKEIVGNAGLFVSNPNEPLEYSKTLSKALKTDWQDFSIKQAQKFSWTQIAEKYSQLFLSVINK